MRILQATSEFFPYSKTGGLADMVAGLSGALVEAGQEVTVASPMYSGIQNQLPNLRAKGSRVVLPLGKREFVGQWWVAEEVDGLDLMFLEQEDFYQRKGIYMEDGDGYWDNPERFMFFSKAVAQLAGEYDVVHLHDWQTAFVPMLLRANGLQNNPRSILTIHNLAYQGQCEGGRFEICNLPWSWFSHEGPEYWGSLNFLKAGLYFADSITTVSPQYAKEILTAEFGEGMEGVLRSRKAELTGILNGVDYGEWNTTNNPHLAATYDADDLSGKFICKRALQKQMSLPEVDVALFGMVSRLAEQKGIDVLVESLGDILCEEQIQFVGLGTGDQQLTQNLRALQLKFPEKVAFVEGYSNPLAHHIEAGADFFVMPSRFEPCGLNQMYSLRYGTVPIVNGVGGLLDTVSDIKTAEPTGYVLDELTRKSLTGVIKEALCGFHSDAHQLLIRNGIREDHSWMASCEEYLKLYEF